ncbi:preprotein translocase subunit SecG [Beggiatoa leptomitoformis]|uniref:Protein-export membrane protein SecG n=1 Tax=Beggiatoa leptomitoformis TaxID=288004 RepID=A0A2N9YBF4_9GAMM|nr:preprotein translocase subunit SecG [Beggiatoa leptomitoformis]ALG66841.1 preprotein translocase subunit SecG [Beggiatoa leptomitoformis]AUI67808.1 preprotein translocase subunit SecG [Beggiatoa leptomitoformis]
MHAVLIVLYVFVCLGLIGLVLIQHGKGADAGAAFGSGASSTVFGSQGSGSFLTRLTAGLATAFFVLSLVLVYVVSHDKTKNQSVTEMIQPVAPVGVPSPTSNTITVPVGGDLPPQPAGSTAVTPNIEVTTTPTGTPVAPAVEVTTTPAAPATQVTPPVEATQPATPPAPPANQ